MKENETDKLENDQIQGPGSDTALDNTVAEDTTGNEQEMELSVEEQLQQMRIEAEKAAGTGGQ